MVQLGIVVTVIEARGGAPDVPSDPVVIVNAADREDPDVFVGESTDECAPGPRALIAAR